MARRGSATQDRDTRSPSKPTGTAEGWTSLVERDSERALIDGALEESERGHGRFVLLYGQAGVGRSSLLRATALDAEGRGIAVLEAAGSELERSYSFGIVRQLLEAPIAALAPAERQSMFSRAGRAAESALGIGPSEDASTAGFDEIEAVHRLITGLAAMTPLLVCVDDLQWCDRPSLDFLCFLGHRATQMPVTIIAAWRRGEPGVRAGRLQALAGKPDTLFLTLAPLSHDGVRAVLKHETGTDPDEAAVDVIQAQTGGQPYLVSELVAGLRLRHLSMTEGCLDAIEAVTPESVRRNVVARLGRHPETVQRFAQAVAVLGDASLAEAAELIAIDHDKARGIADRLVRAGILRDDPKIAYEQCLVRAAVYDALSSLERGELHQRAASLLCTAAPGSDPPDLERVAHHLLRSDPVGDGRFGEVLCEVALHAIGAGALADARRLLVRALCEIDDAAARREVLVRLAQLELRLGSCPLALDHASEALSLASTPSARVDASLACAQAVAVTKSTAAALEVLDSEIPRLDASDTDLELRLRAAAATLRVCGNVPPGPLPDATAGTQSLAGDMAAEREILAAWASDMVLVGSGSAGRVADLCARALADTAGPQDEDVAADYLAGRAALLADAGELIEPVLTSGSQQRTGGVDDRVLSGLALRAQWDLWRGELSDAEVDAHAALAVVNQLPPTALRRCLRSDLLAAAVAIGIERSGHHEAEQALVQLSEVDDPPSLAVGSLRVALALARSEPVRAVELAGEVDGQPIGIAAPGLSWRPWAALAHHAAGDTPGALELAATHLEHARRWGAPSLLGRALVVRGIVDPGAERLEFMGDAVAVLERTSARLELARATIELGAALRRSRRRRESRDQLVRGADLAHRCGADALAARARAELLAVGARPRRAAFSGIESLTESEHRVARLAAAGMTNREIACELTVSTKTVSGQLSAVYRKLDVHDRAALATAMAEAADGDRPISTPELQAR